MQTEKDQPKRFLCRHIFPDGHRCQSPTLRGPTEPEPFCYYHHTTRRPIPTAEIRTRKSSRTRCRGFRLPSPADLNNRSGVQLAIGEVLQQIATGDLDPKRAGLLLYGLQIASLNLPRLPTAKPLTQPSSPIEDFTDDPTLGPLAPPAEVGKLQHHEKGPAELLLEQLDRDFPDDDPVIAYLNAEASPKSTPNLHRLKTLRKNRRGEGRKPPNAARSLILYGSTRDKLWNPIKSFAP